MTEQYRPIRLTSGAKMFLLFLFGAPLVGLYFLYKAAFPSYGGYSSYDSGPDRTGEILGAIQRIVQVELTLCSIHVQYMNDPRQQDSLWSVFDIQFYTECSRL